MSQASYKMNCYRQLLVALGSNVTSGHGSPYQTLWSCLETLSKKGLRISSISRFYQSPAFPAGAGPDFVNIVCIISASQPEGEILAEFHRIEAEFDRVRQVRWGARTLDIDLLAAGQVIRPDRETLQAWVGLPAAQQRTEAPDRLILPHPRLHERAFVLKPLCDVCPDWRHPLLNLTAREMLQALDPEDLRQVRPITG